MTIHELKTWPKYFHEVRRGRKRFEYRKNDRNFQVGDILRLREYEPVHKSYTGCELYTEITYILEDGWMEPGWAILSIGPPSDTPGGSPDEKLKTERLKSRILGLMDGFNAGASVDVKQQEDEIARLESELATARKHIEEMGEQLELDRSLVADCLTKAKNAVVSRDWLTEGRGCYEWNDDRWHEEFQHAANEFLAAIAPMTKVAQNWSGCPKSGEEIAKARIDLKEHIGQLRTAAIAFVNEAPKQGDYALLLQSLSGTRKPEHDQLISAYSEKRQALYDLLKQERPEPASTEESCQSK